MQLCPKGILDSHDNVCDGGKDLILIVWASIKVLHIRLAGALLWLTQDGCEIRDAKSEF